MPSPVYLDRCRVTLLKARGKEGTCPPVLSSLSGMVSACLSDVGHGCVGVLQVGHTDAACEGQAPAPLVLAASIDLAGMMGLGLGLVLL